MNQPAKVLRIGSMVKTLLIGDHVLVDRVSLAPESKWAPFTFYRNVHHGDIIVFLKPGEPDLFLVKRAIGLPGDRIHLRNGVVYLNGVAQNEPYAAMPSASGGDFQGGFNPYRDDFPSVPPDPMYQVTASWQYDLPAHIQDGDLVVRDGEVLGTLHVSTGATGNTPVGHFHVYSKGGSFLYKFMAFLGNFGIHGYVPVPAVPAACLAVFVPMTVLQATGNTAWREGRSPS